MDLLNRPRRLRGSDSIRRLCRETRLSADSLIYPIFVDETLTASAPSTPCPASTTTAWTACLRRWRSASPPG